VKDVGTDLWRERAMFLPGEPGDVPHVFLHPLLPPADPCAFQRAFSFWLKHEVFHPISARHAHRSLTSGSVHDVPHEEPKRGKLPCFFWLTWESFFL